MFDPEKRATLYNDFQAKIRLAGRTFEGHPRLDALLPYFEYDLEKLKASGFFDEWLTAALLADNALNQAAKILAPLGILREDLLLLLHNHMKARLKEQKTAARKRKRRS